MLNVKSQFVRDTIMAHQASGNVSAHAGMSDPTKSNLARDGAAKRPQTNFPVHIGMTDQTKVLSGVSPANPGVGPDASSGNPLDPSPKLKKFGQVPVKWGMRDANGQSINGNASAILSEASVLGK